MSTLLYATRSSVPHSPSSRDTSSCRTLPHVHYHARGSVRAAPHACSCRICRGQSPPLPLSLSSCPILADNSVMVCNNQMAGRTEWMEGDQDHANTPDTMYRKVRGNEPNACPPGPSMLPPPGTLIPLIPLPFRSYFRPSERIPGAVYWPWFTSLPIWRNLFSYADASVELTPEAKVRREEKRERCGERERERGVYVYVYVNHLDKNLGAL